MPRPSGLPKTGGRKKGVPNKTTVAVKDALNTAFTGVGGADGLVTWAQANPTEFYKLWVKMLPTEINLDANVTTFDVASDPEPSEAEWSAQHAR